MPTQPSTNEAGADADTDTSSGPRNAATAYEHAQTNQRIILRHLMLLFPVILLVALGVNYQNHDFFLKLALKISKTVGVYSEVKSDSDFNHGGGLAVCYTGHLGTFEQVREQNMDVFSKLSVPVSYFFVIDLQDDYKDARTNQHFKHMHSKSELESSVPDAVSIETYNSNDLDIPDHECLSDGKKKEPLQDDAGHFLSAYATLHANEKCLKLVKTQEEKTKKRFDWVLRLRPDMQIDVIIPSSSKSKIQKNEEQVEEVNEDFDDSSEKTRTHLSGLAMGLVPRTMADHYFTAVHAFDQRTCEELQDMDETVCQNYSYEKNSPECFLIKWLKRADIVPSNGVYVKRRIIYPELDQ